ncbi:hypothetical protein [Actomonas aquatica]|uniref:DUF4175 domain-containing protein n=1 Tax=Actomonas aquatica TaxID=2866162 RepID=A0ABZ1C9F0_9BACT|nr:hypothetical protein [Opitutus sp. WL0086]WRQ87995.1 hypothetical protein K1X11_001150 [Opitutus sp. WL0086]
MRRPFRLFFSFDARLHEELRSIARHHQSAQLHRHGIHVWGIFAAIALVLLTLRWIVPGFAPWLGPLLLLALLAAVSATLWRAVRNRFDLIATARAIERDYPELKEALRTAAEQKPRDGAPLTFLQRRLLKHALDHAAVSAWHTTPRSAARQYALAHFATLGAAVIIGFFALHQSAPWRTTWDLVWSHAPGITPTTTIEVTPGNQEVERGATVVIAARFPANALPTTAHLVWQNADGLSARTPMVRSLSDPVFATTLSDITADTVYSVSYDDDSTTDFALTVFELPTLVRADAILDYPDYTGFSDRTITDTRRISAVEGTHLDYQFIINRPVARAELHDDEHGTVTPLTAANDDATLFNLTTTLSESARYKLHLVTADGRTDPVPADIRIEVAPNTRPELTLLFPRGDQRVSPIQEITLQAELRDDFGLLDYGIATAIGSADPEYISYHDSPDAVLQAEVSHLIPLEERDVEVDELITWFAWADDYAPDGSVRRSTGDLFFAEVRPLDEIFREDSDGAGGAQSGMQSGGPAGELIEIQRQLSIAIWKLRQEAQATDESYVNDVEVLRDSQAQARSQLAEVRAQLDDPRLRGAAELADRSMDIALDELADAASTPSTDPLDAAWKGSQAAFQALLRLQPKENNIVQNQNGGGSGSRNRNQIDQLRMRRDSNDYATQSQAENETTPEDREQLNLLSRLRELSRRQQDLNDRLQELQTALAAATSEAEREEIRRELKRLEEEQRRMLADLDEARQRLDRMQPGEQREQARQQLEDTRENMQQSSERLADGEVSSALAAGTRAQEQLQQTSDEMRDESSSVFADQLRELRRQARELSEQQEQLAEQFNERADAPPSLDGSAANEDLAEAIAAQQERHAELLDDLRQVTEDSEGTEPTLHRQLYDLMREQGTQGPTRDLETTAELLRQGFLEQAGQRQAGIQEDFEQLRQGIERAADSVLGNEATEMRFATNELEDLAEQLAQERRAATGEDETQPGTEPGSDPTAVAGVGDPGSEEDNQPGPSDTEPGQEQGTQSVAGVGDPGSEHGNQPGPNGTEPDSAETTQSVAGVGDPGPPNNRPSDAQSPSPSGSASNSPSDSPGDAPGDSPTEDEALAQALAQLLGGNPSEQPGGNQRQPGNGPLTGSDFADWADRLRTVESLLEDEQLRQRLSEARAEAEAQRAEWQRHGADPQWDLVETGILEPLVEVQTWLQQELARREDPTSLQPIDRDPVPEKFAESVRRYYESLGTSTPNQE